MFVLDADTGLELDRGVVGGGPGQIVGGLVLRLDAAENIFIGGEFTDTTTQVVYMTVFKFGTLGSWVDLGNGLAGGAGLTPRLIGYGTLTGNSSNQALLTNALPGSITNLVVGLTQLGAPFNGGLLVPSPDVLLLGLAVDGEGAHTLEFTWPNGLPPGITVNLQHWVADSAGPIGYTASNGLQGITP